MYTLKYSLLFCSLLLVITCFSQPENSGVKATLDKFKTALAAKNYTLALNYADSATLSFYDSLLPMVQYADSATLASAALMKKLMVLNFRHRDSASDIKNFDGKQLLVFAMKKQMVSYRNMMGDSIHDIHVQNGLANVITTFKTTNDTLMVKLVKEHNTWRINFINELSYAEALIKRLIQESGKTEDEYLFVLLENITGTPPSRAIWHRQ